MAAMVGNHRAVRGAFILAAAAVMAVAAAAVPASARCTTIIVSAGASADGSVLTSSTSDCKECDFRLARVGAHTAVASNGRGATPSPRPVYEAKFNFPHLVTAGRSPTWEAANLAAESLPQVDAWLPATPPIGFVPQVNATAALYETGSGYALLNEHQVAMGESTCPGRFVAAPVSAGGKALLDVGELSRLGLERGRTAREAIQIMGDLATTYGYYGAQWDDERTKHDEAGEALMVGDPTEAWVFHVLPDDSGASAIWVARRVPDGHMSVVANSFVIRELNTSDTENFLISDTVYSVAMRQGLWNGTGLLDFTAVYGQPSTPNHSDVSTLRVWRAFMLANPSLDLPPLTDTLGSDYPFSVAPTVKIDLPSMLSFLRDHYDGTPYDTSVGLAAGPYGDPDRYDTGPVGNMTMAVAKSGEFPRTINLFRTSYSYVARSSSALPDAVGAMLLFAPHTAGTSAYVPFYLAGADVPPAYATGSLFRYRPGVAFWAFAVVANWTHKYYVYAIRDVQAVQAAVEADIRNGSLARREAAAAARVRAASSADEAAAVVASLGNYTTAAAARAVAAYTAALPALIAKYHDGYVRTGETAAAVTMTTLFYPEWWLTAVGYFRAGDVANAEAAAHQRSAGDNNTAAVTATDGAAVAGVATAGDEGGLWGDAAGAAVLVAGLMAGLGGGFILGSRQFRGVNRRSGYQEIGGG
ncbi:hypothetical protein MMPV_008801 [Pyropia vietnamensis]